MKVDTEPAEGAPQYEFFLFAEDEGLERWML